MRRIVDVTYLHKRDHVWWYNRRVPKQFAHLDTRGRIRQSLNTTSLEEARVKRDLLCEADERYWAALAGVSVSGEAANDDQVAAAEQRYKSAASRALAVGFSYKPIEELTTSDNLEELLMRLLHIRDRAGVDETPKPHHVEAVLGGAERPKVCVSQALEIYINDISHNAVIYKSKHQRYSWKKVKRTSANYFIEKMGDLVLEEITRDHALKYKAWWASKISPKDPSIKPIAANTANRHIGNIRSLYGDYYKHIGEENRPNPFRNIHFTAKTKKDVPAFENDWVQTRVLAPGAIMGIRPDLQLIVYMLIETGCRPSEIINLRPEDIKLDAGVPHISIRARNSGAEKRELKTDTSERDIPLVGTALEAAKRAPNAFEHYRDKNELFSSNILKAFRKRKLFPTPDHVVYSFRHAFEKRMQEANIDYALRCLLMGHKNTRPAYGDGGSLEYRRTELLKIVHPFDAGVFQVFDKEHANWWVG